MPVSEDVTREMVSLFEDGAQSRKASVELTPLLLLKRVINVGDVWDLNAFLGELAVCRSVMLTALDVTHGDRIVVEQRDALVIRFVLPRPIPYPPED
jgi:hypothetical protein